MKYLNKYLEEKLKIKLLGALSTRDDEDHSSFMSGVVVLSDGHETGIFVSHHDYAEWLENKVVL